MNQPPIQADEKDAGTARFAARLREGRHALRRRGRLVIGVFIVAIFYLVAVFADFLAPYDYRAQSRDEPSAPASVIRFRDVEGRLRLRPFVYPRRLADPLARIYEEETSQPYPLVLFPRGHSYKLFGLFAADRHLFGVASDETSDRRHSRQTHAPRVSLLGTDELGRDRFSRLLRASRFSLFVGPAGTLLAGLLGVLIGCLSGYAGRRTDAVLMRAADAMMALPALVLILAARAAFPPQMPPRSAATLMISIFVALGWAEMARLARGLVLSLRSREFVTAAVAVGATPARVLFRHVLPNAARPLVVQASLMLPAFLLAETALSYLGVGVQEPEASWGLMLARASDLAQLSRHPLLLLSPAVAIFVFVLGVRLTSDGLRGDSRGA
ncbi:MAG TPA: ABC transporter permease [Pyrinomonadaceae bacterium]|nr:ABC transporter permease [Pyrinomonadaceae bacterium]